MKRSDHAGPRERLLAAASRLFYEQGYRATGINQIIEEADVAKASFYQHFSSKEALCEAYLSESHRHWNALLEEHLRRYDDPRERVLGLFDFLAIWKEDAGYRGCAFLNIVAEVPDLDSPLRDLALRHYDVFRATVRHLVGAYADACLPSASPEERATLSESLALLFEGAIVSAQTYRSTWPVEAAREAGSRLFPC
jgi:AcrR family transcriptional regulator